MARLALCSILAQNGDAPVVSGAETEDLASADAAAFQLA